MGDRIAPLAVAGGRLLTELVDVTHDVAALDATGTWAVVVPFDGEPVCARFARSQPAPARLAPGREWPAVEVGRWESSLDRDAFEKGVVLIREAIAAGDVYQVNLCRVLSVAVDRPVDIVALFDALAAAHRAPHAALVSLPDHGVQVASASPERFLRRDGDAVMSSPIKGTAVDDRADALLASAKDRAENVMIVDLVRNDLGRVCRWGSVEVAALCRLERHPGLAHLVSTVTGRLRRGTGWPELLAAAFPPGSVTGAPKRAALDHIHRLEPASRGVYCGAVGWVDADARTADLNVAIRTFWVDDGRLRFGTGAGITWDSDAAAEWAETELKASRLLAVAAAASSA
ncbi:MAG: Anthranilate/para-aminobenzoate synthase component [Acidimicrobiales bacterium]|nr:Anthranilate/para-aminobenzoate synthase component [Acidimicrobiales bacterium]